MKTKSRLTISFALLAIAGSLFAAEDGSSSLKLYPLFTNNMVLQRGMPVPVCGTAVAGETVTVSFAGQQKEAIVGKDGKWRLKLDPLEASATPQVMTVSSPGANQTLKVENVLVGDIWACCGQSNMRRTVTEAKDPEREIPAADYPNIRLFEVPIKTSGEPSLELTGNWRPCSPETVADFSAVGYYFGRELYKKLNVPIGLISSCKGSTRAEYWTPREVLEANPQFAPMIRNSEKQGKAYEADREKYKKELAKWEKSAPSRLYNGMIHPLTPFAIKGVIWYQGEGNTRKPSQYKSLLSTMIKAWRAAWGQGDFPFLIVQLANFADDRARSWAELREAQFLVSKSVPNSGLAVSVDIGQPETIHPLNKQDVGARLALAARKVAYGEKALVSLGPVYDSMKIEGDKIRIAFSNIGGGLETKGGELKTFTVAGGPAPVPAKALADDQFTPAHARIEGDSVVVWSDEIKNPVAVRYAWANSPEGCNLYNKEGLPAVPFRTDSPAEPKQGGKPANDLR